MLLYDSQAVVGRESLDCRDIGRVRAELTRELLTGQWLAGGITFGQLAHSFAKSVLSTPSEQHGNLQPLTGIGGANRTRAGQWNSFATLQWNPGHEISVLRLCVIPV